MHLMSLISPVDRDLAVGVFPLAAVRVPVNVFSIAAIDSLKFRTRSSSPWARMFSP